MRRRRYDLPVDKISASELTEDTLKELLGWLYAHVSSDLPLPKALRKLASILERPIKSCKICGDAFTSPTGNAKFCSDKCSGVYYRSSRKKCSGCKKWLSRESFFKDSNNPSGLQSRCKVCDREYQRKYRKSDVYKQSGRYKAERRRDKALYDKRVRQAKPSWADSQKIMNVYKSRDSLGKDYHVDHIVPLSGIHPDTKEQVVCGLHVHNNLKPVDAYYNSSIKGGWFDPESHDHWADNL